ncbi:hypothetical protein acdb102_33050 [Acidothermaceae bacterium B102]|nr:hypothetical protein acdb102_33050 [Acidothermaceae bacterium B102]
MVLSRWSVFVAVSSLVVVGAAPVARATSPTAAPSPYVAVKHVRLLDATVKKSTSTSFALKGIPATGVTSVVLSVSVTSPAASGSLVSYPYGAKRPHAVSLAFGLGHSASGLVVVSAGKKGRAALFNASAASEHIAAVVVGYYAAPGVTRAATAFKPVTPGRLATVQVKAKAGAAFAAVGKLGVPVVDTAAVLVAVTTGPSSGSGSVVLLPYGAKHGTSLAFTAGRTTTTLLVLTPGSKGRVMVTTRSTHTVRVAVDVVGYLARLHVPGAPTAVSATAGDKSALVAWKAPKSNGGAPVSSYTVVATPGDITAQASGAATSVLVRGLSVGTAYTFTVTAANSRGAGVASAASEAVTPFTIPAAPQGGIAATGGYGQVLLAVFPPEFDAGGLPVTSYRAVASPGGAVVSISPTGASYDTTTVSGLTPGTFYTFSFAAVSAAGDSALSPATAPTQAGGVSRASVSDTGAQGDQGSLNSGLSADGRYVVFDSIASNFAPGNSGGHFNVFVRDRVAGTTTLVSAASGGGYSDGDSLQPSISADGRYVAFGSNATNLTGAVVGNFQIYVRDLRLGTTKLISASGGVAADMDTLTSVISADGSTIAFVSKATNLVAPDAGAHAQIIAADRQSGDLTAVSVGVGGVEANGDSSQPAISGDGKIVAWTSAATNLVSPPISTTYQQVYQRVLASSTTAMLSSISGVAGDAAAGDPSIATDGSYTAFDSVADNLVGTSDNNHVSDVFVCYKGCGSPTLIDKGPFGAPANRGAALPSLSQTGSIIAYQSASTDLVNGAVPTLNVPQIFVTAWSSNTTIVASKAADGGLGNAASASPHLTGDAAHVSFLSSASNLVPGDTNSRVDVFVEDLPVQAAGGLPSY